MSQEAKYATIDCPTDCENINTLLGVSFQSCVDALEIFESEICDFYITIPDENGDATNKPTWDAAGILAWRNNFVGDAAADTVRRLVVIGDMDDEEGETASFSKRRKKRIGNKKFVVNITIDDLSDENREFCRALECGATVVAWFQTIGGNFFGGNAGILGEISNVKLPLERGENNYEYATMKFTFYAKNAPPRIASPL